MTEQAHAIYSPQGRVGELVLNRPDKLNALSMQLQHDLHAALDAFERDDAVRVGILRGEGRAFCVGFDLSPSSDGFRPQDISAWGDRERLRSWTKLFARIWDCPKPIIAQVHGHCLAGGVMLPLVADVTVIARECKLGWPKLPMGGGFVAPLFARAVGPGRAKLMEFMAGSEIDGTTAANWGYAAQAVPQAELAAHCMELAQGMARMSSQMLHLKKSSINRVFDLAGFQQTLVAGTEWDTLAHEDPSITKVRGWVREDGMKAAIARFRSEGL